jgi:hypothetical protein
VVATLEELARILGGVASCGILQTRIGNFEVHIFERSRLGFAAPVFELRVVVPDLPGDALLEDGSMPSLQHGYMFAGNDGGVLVAIPRTLEPPTLEQIVSTLWELAGLARQSWVVIEGPDYEALERRERRRTLAFRLVLVAIGIAIALVLRWPR